MCLTAFSPLWSRNIISINDFNHFSRCSFTAFDEFTHGSFILAWIPAPSVTMIFHTQFRLFP